MENRGKAVDSMGWNGAGDWRGGGRKDGRAKETEKRERPDMRGMRMRGISSVDGIWFYATRGRIRESLASTTSRPDFRGFLPSVKTDPPNLGTGAGKWRACRCSGGCCRFGVGI